MAAPFAAGLLLIVLLATTAHGVGGVAEPSGGPACEASGPPLPSPASWAIKECARITTLSPEKIAAPLCAALADSLFSVNTLWSTIIGSVSAFALKIAPPRPSLPLASLLMKVEVMMLTWAVPVPLAHPAPPPMVEDAPLALLR